MISQLILDDSIRIFSEWRVPVGLTMRSEIRSHDDQRPDVISDFKTSRTTRSEAHSFTEFEEMIKLSRKSTLKLEFLRKSTLKLEFQESQKCSPVWHVCVTKSPVWRL